MDISISTSVYDEPSMANTADLLGFGNLGLFELGKEIGFDFMQLNFPAMPTTPVKQESARNQYLRDMVPFRKSGHKWYLQPLHNSLY